MSVNHSLDFSKMIRKSIWTNFITAFVTLLASSIAQGAVPGTPLATEVRINSTAAQFNRYPRVARAGSGEYAVFWWLSDNDDDILARFYSSYGKPVAPQFTIHASAPSSQQTFPSAGFDNSGVLTAVWSSNGSASGIFRRRFDLTGKPLGSEVQISPGGGEFDADIAVAGDGRSAVAWQDVGRDADASNGIYATTLSADGATSGPSFAVPSNTANSQANPAVAIDASGKFVVVWEGDGDGTDVFSRRFDALGQPVGAETRVNTSSSGEQLQADVAMSDNGIYAVAWLSDASIRARLYGANGVPLTDEFNVSNAGSVFGPAIAMDRKGDFIISWADSSAGTFRRISAQLYDSTGSAVGPVQLVSSETDLIRDFPSVAMDADGDAVVSWEATDVSGSSPRVDIFHRRLVGPEDIDLAVSVSDADDFAAPLSRNDYTITVENRHAAASASIGGSAGVQVQLSSHDALSLASVNDPAWDCDRGGFPLVCTLISPLPPASSVSLAVFLDRPNGTCSIVRADVVAASEQFDSLNGNNAASDSTVVGVPGTLDWTPVAATVGEAAGTASVEVERHGGCAGSVSVDYAAVTGTAIEGVDFSGNGTLNWANGDGSPKSAMVSIVNDVISESSENFSLLLSNSSGGAVIGAAKKAVTVADDDSPSSAGGGGSMSFLLLALLTGGGWLRRRVH